MNRYVCFYANVFFFGKYQLPSNVSRKYQITFEIWDVFYFISKSHIPNTYLTRFYFTFCLQRKSSLMPLLLSWWNQIRASLNWRKNIKKSLRPWEKGNKKKGPWFKRINVLQLKNWSNPKEGMELLFVEKGILAKKKRNCCFQKIFKD